jgi:TolB protein
LHPAEELFLESTAAGIPKMDIAVVKFQPKRPDGPKRLSSKPWKIIASDLKFSGRFNVSETGNVDTVFFREKNAAVYIAGTYDIKGNKVIMECSLHDAFSLKRITGKQYRVSEKALRRATHLFSDLVVYQLFGEKGIASTRIVCVARYGKSKEICILDYDGHNLTKVTNNKQLNLSPAWSPDNKAVVYTSYRQKTPALYITWLYSGKTRRITPNSRLNFSPGWNGIEDRIVFATSLKGNCEIHTMDSDGTNLTRLTFTPSIESSPCFSPNGYEIAFTADRTGNPQIYIMDNEGTNVRRLTFEGKYNDSPSWSPRGDKIAYMSLEKGGFNIYTINTEGGEIKQLTRESRNNEHPSFSPDGRLIVFSSTRGGGSDLYLMSADGAEQTRITSFGNLYSPEWSGFME